MTKTKKNTKKNVNTELDKLESQLEQLQVTKAKLRHQLRRLKAERGPFQRPPPLPSYAHSRFDGGYSENSAPGVGEKHPRQTIALCAR